MTRPGPLGRWCGRGVLQRLLLGLAWLACTVPAVGAPVCAPDGGPAGLRPASWREPAAARKALSQPGFGRVSFDTKEGRPMHALSYRASGFRPADGPIWFVMHGVDRDPERYLDAAAPWAERHGALLVVPEYARSSFPTSENYTLGVTRRGRADESAGREGRWRAPTEFAYLEVERLFEALRGTLAGRQRGYYLFGHSAGAQFTHRLLTFVPCARVLAAVAANAGWYTLPLDNAAPTFALPYGLGGVPAGLVNPRALLGAKLTLLLGTRDTAAAGDDDNLRDTPAARSQGPHRVARGRHYFETGRQLARRLGVPFGWQLHEAPGAGHQVREVIGSAAHLLFSPDTQPCRPTAAAEAAALRLQEVLADPPPGPAGDLNRDGVRRAADEEFVELVNTGPAPLCLAGWTLSEAGGRGGHLFPLGPALAPGRAMLVFGGGVPVGDFGGAQVQRASAAAGLALDGPGEVLGLRDGNGRLALQLSWGDCGGRPCAAEHWPGSLRINASLARGTGAAGPWRAHNDLASTPASPGLRVDGRPW
jgi:hypothetical protein